MRLLLWALLWAMREDNKGKKKCHRVPDCPAGQDCSLSLRQQLSPVRTSGAKLSSQKDPQAIVCIGLNLDCVLDC